MALPLHGTASGTKSGRRQPAQSLKQPSGQRVQAQSEELVEACRGSEDHNQRCERAGVIRESERNRQKP